MWQQIFSRKVTYAIPVLVIPIYVGLTCTNSSAKAPKSARITQPADLKGITIRSKRGQELSLSTELDYGKALWIPALPERPFATLRFKDWYNNDMKLEVKAISYNNALTKYKVPCKVQAENYGQAVITWESGTKRGCEEGMRVTSKSNSASQKVAPYSSFLANESKDLFEANPDSASWKSKAFLKAEAGNDDARYYCSALPTSGGGSAGMAAGFNSVEEACEQATQKCLKNNSGSGCSIETMGEWSVNDPELMSSVTCKNGKSSHKRVRGSDISDPNSSTNAILNDLLKQVLGDVGGFLAGLLNLKPGTCVLEVYHPDEVLISPVNSQQTVVQAIDVGSGSVQVNVQEGQALLRSTQSPKGIVANQGQSYIFNGEGAINQGRETRPYSPPAPYTSPSPSPAPYTSPSPTP